MQRYMERFGFYAEPPLDYPDAQMSASGVRKGGRLVPMTSDRVDVGRVAIGQGDLFATPLQMATVAQTIGNGGVRLKPHIMAKAVDPDGRTVDEVEPEEEERVVSARTASDLTAMMKNVVREGTGTAAALSGVEVAGKTGTAELNDDRAQPAVVHVLHARRRRRDHARAVPGRHRRDRRRADRQAGARGAGPVGRCRRSIPTPWSTAATGSSGGSAPAAWPTSTRRRTPSSAGGSRSSCSTAASPRTPTSSSASAARRPAPPR